MLLFHVYLSIKVALDLFRCYGGALIVYSSIFYKGMCMHVIMLYNKYNRHWYVVIHVCRRTCQHANNAYGQFERFIQIKCKLIIIMIMIWCNIFFSKKEIPIQLKLYNEKSCLQHLFINRACTVLLRRTVHIIYMYKGKQN